MFMPAGELRKYDSVDRRTNLMHRPVGAGPETIGELWNKKLRESKRPAETGGHGAGVYDSVKEKGVLTPVNVTYKKERGYRIPTIGNGNHRVAAQADIDPERLVPVIHHDNLQDATIGGYEPATKRAEAFIAEQKRRAEWKSP